MPQFIVNPVDIKNNTCPLSTADSHHLLHVFRARPRDTVVISDGLGKRYAGKLTIIEQQALITELEPLPPIPPPYDIRLCLALLKKDKLEWVIQKSSELNIANLYLFPAEHSLKQAISPTQWKRYERIAVEAAKQCGRDFELLIKDFSGIKECVETVESSHAISIVCDEKTFDPNLRQWLKSLEPIEPNKPLSLWIGPEGGWTDEERHYLDEMGATFVSLGALTLRSETAALHAISQIIAFNEA